MRIPASEGEHATQADGDLHAGRAVLDPLEVVEVAGELVVGVLAHGAVAEHDARLHAVRDWGVARLVEQGGDALGRVGMFIWRPWVRTS